MSGERRRRRSPRGPRRPFGRRLKTAATDRAPVSARAVPPRVRERGAGREMTTDERPWDEDTKPTAKDMHQVARLRCEVNEWPVGELWPGAGHQWRCYMGRAVPCVSAFDSLSSKSVVLCLTCGRPLKVIRSRVIWPLWKLRPVSSGRDIKRDAL